MLNRKQKKIFVNILSMSRILGAILMPLFFSVFKIPVVIAIIIILFITDALDGFFARLWKVQTRGGALLDPLGDKMLAVSFILSFIMKDKTLFIPLILELGITVLNIDRTLHGEEFKTSIMGKLKTWVLFVTLALSGIKSLNPDFLNNIFNVSYLTITRDITDIALIITLVCQVLTIILYTKDSFRKKNERSKKVPELKKLKDVIGRLFDEEAYLIDRDKPLIEIIKK